MYWYSIDYDFVVAISIILLPFFLYKLYKSSLSFFQKIVLFCTYFYFFGVIWVCFLPIGYSTEIDFFRWFQFPIQYIPLHTVFEMFSGLTEYNPEDFIPLSEYIRVFATQIGGNIILLTPMWIALPYLYQNINHYKQALKIWFFITLGIEISQLWLMMLVNIISFFGIKSGIFFIDYYKVFDIDDLILNTLWFLIWYSIFRFLEKFSLQKNINNLYKKFFNKKPH